MIMGENEWDILKKHQTNKKSVIFLFQHYFETLIYLQNMQHTT